MSKRLWFENSFPRFGYRFDLFFCIHLVDGHLVLPELLLDKTMEAGLLAGHTSLASLTVKQPTMGPHFGGIISNTNLWVNFEGFPENKCIVWVGKIVTPVI